MCYQGWVQLDDCDHVITLWGGKNTLVANCYGCSGNTWQYTQLHITRPDLYYCEECWGLLYQQGRLITEFIKFVDKNKNILSYS